MSEERAREALTQREYTKALTFLKPLLAGPQSDGRLHALAGLAHFELEQYAAAAEEYDKARQAGGSHSECREWLEMHDLSKANQAAQINVEVPEPHYFNAADLLKPPSVPGGDLRCPTDRPPRRGCVRRLRLFLGEALGELGTVVIDVAIQLVGWIYDYRARVWTNWYGRPLLRGVLILAYIRELLNTNNLESTYPAGQLVAFQRRGQPRPPGSRISARPTEAGTVWTIPKRALPARASCAMSIFPPPAPRRARDWTRQTRAKSASSY